MQINVNVFLLILLMCYKVSDNLQSTQIPFEIHVYCNMEMNVYLFLLIDVLSW